LFVNYVKLLVVYNIRLITNYITLPYYRHFINTKGRFYCDLLKIVKTTGSPM